MTIILGTSSVVLLLTCTAFLAYEFLTFRQAAVRQLSTLGEIVAANSTGVLAFDNEADATEILSALQADRHIVAACLYDQQGKLFARYPAAAREEAFPVSPGVDGYHFEASHLVGFAPVAQVKGQRLGTLYLKSDLVALYDRLRLYGGIALLVMVGSSLVAYILSRKLQQQISRPILALADTAKAVSDRRDYSVRARRFGGGELGLLTEAFNHMLEQIEEQNLALQRAYDDLRQTQQAITQQERLRALGQMASGIAHDINNAISPASLYAESLLEREPNLSVKARAYLTTIQRAIDDVAQTVSRLREFYRQREPQLTLAPVSLNQLVEQVAELTRAHWSDMAQQHGVVIELKMNLVSPLPAVMGVESEIREALTNLVFNAVDAMPGGGTLTLRTRLTEERLPEGKSASDSYVSVEVADTGVGMDEETKRRCLEPFFTTKGERGTGLGLAMVYGTMRRHDAGIEIDSVPGRGTTMRLLFPLPTTAVELPSAAGPALMASTRLRALVVDDDLVLLKSLTETLEDDGHEIVAANGGQAGIDAFVAAQNAGRPFAVVITDLGMPHVDGRKVASAVKSASPSTPVFLLTGWGQGMAAEGDIPAHVDRMLTKPPKLRELREALASV
jgi:signal transduction histidine kinase/ActR/RegA family two-component response regulator